MAWLFLLGAGVLEIMFTTTLRFVDGFKNIPWTIVFVLCTAACMFCLNMATRQIPLGTAYAVWVGIGAIGTLIIGMVWFHEPVSIVRNLLIFLLVGSIIGLKLTSGN